MTNDYARYVQGGYAEVFVTYRGLRLAARVSLCDFAKVRSISGTWGVKWNPTAQTYYVRWQAGGRKNRRIVYLHRFILNVTDPKVHVDHDDHDGLNNLRPNLKLSNRMSNGFNRRGAERGSKSGRRNVYWNRREQKWMVWVVCQGKRYYVGYFKDVDAADDAAKRMRVSLGGKA